jgi:SdrD B-like domain/Domain of unknown function DUF11
MHWASRLFRQAVCTARPKARRKARRLRVESLEGRDVPTVLGTAYVDLNLNGVQDIDDLGAAGVTVTATDANGAVETVTTAADGTYTLQTSADVLRIAFSNLPRNTIAGRVTDTAGPLVRFLDADSNRVAVDLALTAPNLVTTQFFYDDALNGANSAEAAVSSVAYAGGDVVPNTLATVAEVGSVWGTTYQPSSNRIFTSAFLKRHAGFGPAADGTSTTTGGIYSIDPTGTNPPTLLIDLNTAGAGLGTGADTHPTTTEGDGGDWFHDTGSIGQVGKRSLGGLAISTDGKTLYTVNLNTRELVEIPLKADGTVNTAQSIRHTPIPLNNPGGAGILSFNANDLRPFAVTVRGNAVFVGVTFTAETSGSAADLRGFVYAFDPATGAFRSYIQSSNTFNPIPTPAPAPVLTVRLNYARGLADDPTPDEPASGDEVPATWKAWTSSFVTSIGQDGFPVHPEPWLTSIAFDGANMVLGIRDRFGDRGGYLTGSGVTGDTTEYSVIAAGDILRAGPNGTGWLLEANAAAGGVTTGGAGNGQGPGGGEYYYEDSADPIPQEIATGGLTQVPGFQTIAATGNDPITSFGGGLYTFFNSGVGAAGTVDAKTGVYESFDLNTFGSSNGMGGVSALPGDGTVQVGDRVFVDTNANGLQDANEAGIAGVVLTLFANGTQADSVTTGAGGDYLFDGLQPNTAYQIRLDTTQAALAGRSLAQANQGTDDLLDSDATLAGTTATIALTTGEAGSSDHSFDVGFTGTAVPGTTVTLGNVVFFDVNNNGFFDGPGGPPGPSGPDVGISGVTVELLDAAGTNVLSTTTTSTGGVYSFVSLAPGTYQVRLPASNFTGTGALVGFVGSTLPVADPNNNVDYDNNGITTGTLGSGGVIQSGPISLALGAEPTLDGDGPDGNLTVDFGLAPANTLTLGNLVFKDVNNNGVFDTGDTGINGVTVELLDQPGTTVLKTTTTAGGGLYTFTGLAAGTYRARLAALNFSGTGPLVGFTPSATSVANADANADNDSNGTTSGTLGSGGTIVTGPITLAAGAEPNTDGDGTDGNLTLDFGLVAPAAGTLTLGNLVWNDANGNGTFDTLETGINGVSVQLLSSAGTVLQTTTTASGGLYTFTGLAADDYRVRLAASNFQTGAALANFTASTGNTSVSPNDNVNNNNDGTAAGGLGLGGYIESGLITLAAGTEPTNDGDDSNSNLTVDFAVVPIASNTMTLGDRVFVDTNNNGTLDGSETGLDGVTVQLLNSSSVVLKTIKTAGGGTYSFTGLAAGNYKVRLPSVNFPAGGIAEGYTSSTGTGNAFEGAATPDPDSNVNDDDNGNSVGAVGLGGFIESGVITLALNSEPTNDGDASANTNLTLDFGLVAPAAGTLTLGNLVWNDANSNGIFDAQETGINGVGVELLDTAGTVLKSTTTTGGGLYTFTGLAAGDYRVRLAASNFQSGNVLANFTASSVSVALTPNDDVNNNNDGTVAGVLGNGGFVQSGLVSLGGGSEPTNDGDGANGNLTVDFAMATVIPNSLTLGNQVFGDTNNNGILDGAESGIDGVTVLLVSPQDIVLKTTTTAGGGFYAFTAPVLSAGDYKVRLSPANFNPGGTLVGYTSSTGTGNAFEGALTPDPDSNVNGDDNGTTTGTLGFGGYIESGLITLAQNAEPTNDGDANANTNLTLDFGVVPAPAGTLSLGGSAWIDVNNNGLLDPTETGNTGISVQLVNSSGVAIQTTTTGANGKYTFTALAAGDYKVRLAPSNFTGTGPLVGYVSSTGTNGAATGAFEGAATPDPDTNTPNDDNGQVTGVLGTGGFIETGLITLAAGAEPTTDGDGADSNQTIDLGVFQKLSIGNTVFNDANNNGTQDAADTGIANVTVRLLNPSAANAVVGTTTTNAQGQYLFSNLLAGSYVVELAASNFNAGAALFNFKSSTGGAGNGFEPAPVGATDKQDHGSTTGTLGSGGTVASGTIALTATGPTGETPNTDTSTPDAQANLTVDFGLFQPAPTTASIAGRVFLDFNNNGTVNGPDSGMSGVTLTLSSPALTAPITVLTDSLGNFIFNNLPAGTYTLTETQPTTPANQNGKTIAGTAGGTATANTVSGITLAVGKAGTGYNFGEIPLVQTSGFVFEDKNGNGKKDSGEPGVPGALVTLTGTDVLGATISAKTATTDASGAYLFNALLPGTYAIAETQPNGFTDGKEENGTPTATVANDKFTGINLMSVATSSGFNFGETKSTSIAGFVYGDANNNGAKDTGENGIAGASVRLLGTNDLGQSIDKTLTTGADGGYTFGNLRPGTYRLAQMTQPAGFQDGKETAGNAGGVTTTNERILDIPLTSGLVATGYLFGETSGPDLTLTQSSTSTRINVNGTVTITYTMKNRGTATATAAKAIMNFAGLTFVSASVPADFNAATKIWTVGDLGAGATKTIQITLSGAAAGTYVPSSQASTTATELLTTNNKGTSTIAIGDTPLTPPPPVGSSGFLASKLWFLSSSTNAFRRRR